MRQLQTKERQACPQRAEARRGAGNRAPLGASGRSQQRPRLDFGLPVSRTENTFPLRYATWPRDSVTEALGNSPGEIAPRVVRCPLQRTRKWGTMNSSPQHVAGGKERAIPQIRRKASIDRERVERAGPASTAATSSIYSHRGRLNFL